MSLGVLQDGLATIETHLEGDSSIDCGLSLRRDIESESDEERGGRGREILPLLDSVSSIFPSIFLGTKQRLN